jgi:hypothetical protein
MGVAGVRGKCPPIGSLIPKVIGNGPTQVGIGSATNPGAGRASITGRGKTILNMAGCGFREQNGHRRGSRGVTAMITLAGRPADRVARC